mmetsp:Transcript_10737/g.49421  ORF Transcript_10737/g.49421 Transcript_10737/m.49421 type:complete len:235 (-) Transcript_10737:587-1291(-)
MGRTVRAARAEGELPEHAVEPGRGPRVLPLRTTRPELLARRRELRPAGSRLLRHAIERILERVLDAEAGRRRRRPARVGHRPARAHRPGTAGRTPHGRATAEDASQVTLQPGWWTGHGHHRGTGHRGAATQQRHQIVPALHSRGCPGTYVDTHVRRRPGETREIVVCIHVHAVQGTRRSAPEGGPPVRGRLRETPARRGSEQIHQRVVEVVVPVGPHDPSHRQRPVPQRAEHLG